MKAKCVSVCIKINYCLGKYLLFTTGCLQKIGFLQCKDGDNLSLPPRELEGKDNHT